MLRRIGIAGAVLGLAGASVGGYYWFRSPEQPSPYRVPIAQLRQDSRFYLVRHAQSALSCPAGSTNCLVCNMQDAAGNLACQDHAGGAVSLTAVGTPSYQLHTPIPKSDGFTWDAVGFNGSTDYFAAGAASVGDQATNDFALSGWVCPRTLAVDDVIVSKREAGGVGFAVTAGAADSSKLYIAIQDASGATVGAVTPAAALANGVCSFYSVNFDRNGNATAYVNGSGGATTVDISGRALTIASAAVLTVGRAASAASNYWDGRMAGVLIHNGLVTLAEHQAMYKAFHVPTAGDVGVNIAPSYTQTTSWKWPLPSDGSGARLGTYGPGQWPVAYASTLVDAQENPLGLGFPGHNAVTNVIGYPNEFNSWTASGAVVTTNAAEAPDGSVTAERITFSANAQYLLEGVVGGGTIAAGERWCFQLAYKKVSGTCVGINIRASSGSTNTPLTDATTWTWATVCDTTAATAKRGVIFATAHGSCVLDVADSSYHQNNLPVGSCTNCTGAVNCVCNDSYYTQNWSSRSSYMPLVLERGEGIITAAIKPENSVAGIRRHLAHFGDWAYFAEGIQPAFVKRNGGGMPSTVGKGKPLQINEEKRQYIGSWDYRNGLPNTSPRKTAALALSINGAKATYQPSSSEGRYVTASVDASHPATQRDLNAQTVSVGCNILGNNCVDAVIQDATLWSRPAQEVRVDDPTLVVAVDFTGSSWLKNASVPRLNCPSGVSTANCWTWDMGEYSGSLYDRYNGVALAATGTPTYQVNSGLISRGQGRRGWNFVRASSERVYASSNTVNSIGSGTGWTLAWIAQNSTTGLYWYELGPSTGVGAGSTGYGAYMSPAGAITCSISKAGVRRNCTANVINGTKPYQVACVYHQTAGTWDDPLVYINGVVQVTGCGGVAPAGDIDNSGPFTIGKSADEGDYFYGQFYEVRVSNTARSAAEILANYKQTVQQGTYWADDANTVAHYKFNERTVTNGIGLRDHSGNSNHLTVVNGTPDPQYRPMPWPAGSGVVRPAVLYPSTVNYHQGGSFELAANQPFSLVEIVRVSTAVDNVWTMAKQGGNPYFAIWFNSTTANCVFTESGGTATTASTALSGVDGRKHLVACKLVPTGVANQYRAHVSVDGGAFVAAAATITGTITGAGTLKLGASVGATGWFSSSGAMIVKNYALTDADVAAMWNWTSGPYDDLTYARTSTLSRGLCYETAMDPIDGLRVTCFGDNQVPFAYDSTSCNFPGNLLMCLGEPVHSAVANLALQSEDAATTWANNNTSEVANSALAPDGTMTADTVTATAASGDLRQVFAAITAVSHTYCQYLKRNGTADVAGFIRLVTESTGVAIASTAFTATSAWQKFCVSGTATLNDTRIVTEITTNGQSVFWWGAQLTATASNPGPYCPTNNASQTCNAPTSNYVAAANLASWDRSEGVISYAIGWNGAYSAVAFDLALASAAGRMYTAPAGAAGLDIWNGAGVIQLDLRNAGTPSAGLTGVVTAFDSQVAFYGTRRGVGVGYGSNYAGVWTNYIVDTGANWVAGVTNTNLHLGTNYVYSGTIQSNLYEVYIWNDR